MGRGRPQKRWRDEVKDLLQRRLGWDGIYARVDVGIMKEKYRNSERVYVEKDSLLIARSRKSRGVKTGNG